MTRWQLIFQALGLASTLDNVRTEWFDMVEKVAEAFPNPLRVTEAILLGTSGMVSKFLLISHRGMFELFRLRLKADGMANRVTTLDKAARGAYAAFEQTFGELTFTGKNDLLEAILEWLAKFVYGLVKDIAFIRKLLKIKSEAELVALFLRKAKGTLVLARLLGVVLAVVFALASLSFGISFAMLYLGADALYEFVLPQDSRRERVKVPKGETVRKRVNLGPGPDQ